MPDKAAVKPVRTRTFAPLLGCDVVRIVAYRAECACGYKGSGRRTVELARADKREHMREHAS